MADAPRPIGRTKNIRIPAGQEQEYGTDAAGRIIHKQYGSDPEVDAIVLPSALGLDRHGSGGQHRADFDPRGLDIKQNIIVFGEDGARTVAQTTGRELEASIPKGQQTRGGLQPGEAVELSEDGAEQLGEDAEEVYRGLAAGRKKAAAVAAAPVVAPLPQAAPAAPRASVLHIEEDYVPMPTTKKKAKKKKAVKKSRRVVETEEPEEQEDAGEQRAHQLPVEVVISAPFGRLSQTFSAVFIDNGNLILCTDKRLVPLYTLPSVEEPMEMTVEWAGQTVRCVWAGISFKLPHVPVTFTVLLIDEQAPATPEVHGAPDGYLTE